jgi:hypothetical protein
VLDTQDVAGAIKRLKKGFGLRVVKQSLDGVVQTLARSLQVALMV